MTTTPDTTSAPTQPTKPSRRRTALGCAIAPILILVALYLAVTTPFRTARHVRLDFVRAVVASPEKGFTPLLSRHANEGVLDRLKEHCPPGHSAIERIKVVGDSGNSITYRVDLSGDRHILALLEFRRFPGSLYSRPGSLPHCLIDVVPFDGTDKAADDVNADASYKYYEKIWAEAEAEKRAAQ